MKNKKESEKRIRISITISPEIDKLIEEYATNKSRYIEYALLEYFTKCGLDTSKIKL